MRFLSFALLFVSFPFVNAQELYIKPYLQNASPQTMVIMWEMDAYAESFVEWGTDSTLSNTSSTTYETTFWPAYLFTSKLEGLEPGHHYYYRVVSGFSVSEIYDFYTPEEQSAEESIRLIAMSDMQQSSSYPDVFNNLIEGSVLPYMDEHYDGPLNQNLDLFLVPGDLVNNGYAYSEYKNHFFEPAENLLSIVPTYPVLGNHEADANYFFQYFDLPKDGTSGYEEHWWSRDESNIKIIGLDSNTGYRIEPQLNWLDSVLVSACTDPDIDFVFAELHHPHESELWIAGNTDYTGEVITRLENFSTDCGKPSIHFYGHTHGYSRGQSRDHEHLMVNVASGGGHLDYWGAYAQVDYEEFTITQDEYGFVFVEVEAGDDPKFTLKRLSIGDDTNVKNTTLEDSITVRLHNLAPVTPTAIFPLENDSVNPDCLVLQLSDFSDPDNDDHGATQWQISNSCTDFSEPIVDKWLQFENWYFDVNTLEGNDLCEEQVSTLEANQDYCWRARHRDQSLAWSDWSNPTAFYAGSYQSTQNLLLNPGAENGIDSWLVQDGALESLTDGECAGTSPYEGSRYFGVGGLCVDNEFGSAYQLIDLNDFAALVDSHDVYAIFGAYMSDYNGMDIPSFALEFLDSEQNLISSTDTTSSNSTTWSFYEHIDAIPLGTRYVKFILMGQRNSGSDNDSYIDNAFLRISLSGDSCNAYNVSVLNFGCTDEMALNYDILAEANDGSCVFPLICSEGFSMLSLELQTDPYPEETSWDLQDEMGNVIYAVSTIADANTLYVDSVCVPNDQQITFNIYDSYGDGLTSLAGDGYFNLYVCNELILSGSSFNEVLSQPFTPCASQVLNLTEGWNMVSTYMLSEEMNMEFICAEITDHIVVAKDYLGAAYLPEWDFNGIGDWDLTQGYQFKVSQDVSIAMSGDALAPEVTPISLNEGWNIISYLRIENAPTEAVFEAVVDEVVIVKNSLGLAYLPEWGFDGIGEMKAGQGYQVKMSSDETLTYNANDIDYRTGFLNTVDNQVSSIEFSKNTGANMHVLIPEKTWGIELNSNDEIHVYSKNHLLVGAAKLTLPNTLITLWGEDTTAPILEGLQSGEEYFMVLYSTLTNTQSKLSFKLKENSATFEKDNVVIVDQIQLEQNEKDLELYASVPNPATHMTQISYFVPKKQNISLRLFTILGEEVTLLESGVKSTGYHSLLIDVNSLSAGSYFYQLQSETTRITKRLEVFK